MGYIAPVTQYEYIQYANRTVESEKKTVRQVTGTEPIFPVSFDRQLDMALQRSRVQPVKTQKTEEDRQGHSGLLTAAMQVSKKELSAAFIERKTAEVTGKGWFVNSVI